MDTPTAVSTDLPTMQQAPSNRELFHLVQKAVSNELLTAHNYATRATIYLRVLKRISDYMGIPWSMIQDLKSLVPIHSDCLRAVELIFQCQQRRLTFPAAFSGPPAAATTTAAVAPTLEEMNTFEKFMSRDYSRPADVMKLIHILFKRESNIDKRNPETTPETIHWGNLHQLVAADGFLGSELKNYWDNLRYPFENCTPDTETDFRFVHVYAVRRMHQTAIYVKPALIHRAIQRAFQTETFSLEEDPSVENLKSLYVSIVGHHLESIRGWKLFEEGQYLSKKNVAKPEHVGEKRKRGRQPKRLPAAAEGDEPDSKKPRPSFKAAIMKTPSTHVVVEPDVQVGEKDEKVEEEEEEESSESSEEEEEEKVVQE